MRYGQVEIAAPSRLHFGLFSWGNPGRRFGGVGVMVEPPGLRIVAEPLSDSAETTSDLVEFTPSHKDASGNRRMVVAPRPEVDSESEIAAMRTRIADFRQRWAAFHQANIGPRLLWKILETPPRHAGLGSGTQWGLSVAAALDALSGRSSQFSHVCLQETREPTVPPTRADENAARVKWVREAAASVGRGARSAVGAYGFALGGLIIEPGKTSDETLSPLERRFEVPEDWRFVLVCPRIVEATSTTGLHGAAERLAFAQLPPVPTAVTEQLRYIALEQIGPAVEKADCAAFGDAVYHYGVVAGNCFAALQGGPFNGPVLTELAARMRALGARGVGQSSWGPTLFAVMPTEMEAGAFASAIASNSAVPVDVRIAAPNNRGAAVRRLSGGAAGFLERSGTQGSGSNIEKKGGTLCQS